MLEQVQLFFPDKSLFVVADAHSTKVGSREMFYTRLTNCSVQERQKRVSVWVE